MPLSRAEKEKESNSSGVVNVPGSRRNALGLSPEGGNIGPPGKVGSVIFGYLFCRFLSLFFIFLRKLVGKAAFVDREKASVYECGFEPMCPTRVSFSLRFFLIAVIFLVFDLEVVLLFPFVLGMRTIKRIALVATTAAFLAILSLGLAHEHKEGSLD